MTNGKKTLWKEETWALSNSDTTRGGGEFPNLLSPQNTNPAYVCRNVRKASNILRLPGQNGTGAGFLRALWFPLPILIPPTATYSLILVSSGDM
jgi:hypothetical protein